MRLLWDASTLVKRYAPEVGSETVNALWAAVPGSQITTTFPIYAEAYSIMLRKHNRHDLRDTVFLAARSLLRAEVINSLDFVVLATDTSDVLSGIGLMKRHNINSSDATFLSVCLRYASATGDVCIVIAADARLLRAAAAEGLRTLNPEQTPAADVPTFLVAL